jgi:hypothetical protein
MFCRDFEKVAGDLAAGHLMEAANREHALRHASECSACALRLNAERALEAGLRGLGEGAEDREAPPHLKTALRAAFDRQIKLAPVLTSAPARSRKLALQWLAAAALILIAVAVALWSRTAPSNPSENVLSERTLTPSPIPALLEQSPQQVIEPVNQKQKIEIYDRNVSIERRARRRAETLDDMALNDEIVTDYIPLTYLADATAVDSGMVLRVELPPSALVTMGLPASFERTDSPVKADLVVGDDGVARAVRFVR